MVLRIMEIRPHKFTIRVYGLWIHEGKVLVAEEIHKGKRMNKFPGGGLEPGEGTRQCLEREFKEETGIAVAVGDHYYTTDFFVASAFDPQVQVMSIYYRVHALEPLQPQRKQLDLEALDDEIFRWISPAEVTASQYFTFPIDQYVGEMLWRELLAED